MQENIIKNLNSLPDLANDYLNADPFPHIVLMNIWNRNFLDAVRVEVEGFSNWDGEKNFYGSQKKRWQSDFVKLPSKVQQIFNYLNSPVFLRILEEITGENSLIPDPYLMGGGIHSTGAQGFLKLHADFNWHVKMKVYRRLNLLIYLNKNWHNEFKGNLELAEKKDNGEFKIVKSIKPIFNTTVIFTTSDYSYHGQSEPLNTPENIRRNSLAVYYYVSEKPHGTSDMKRTWTDYRNLKGEVIR